MRFNHYNPIPSRLNTPLTNTHTITGPDGKPERAADTIALIQALTSLRLFFSPRRYVAAAAIQAEIIAMFD